MTGSVFSIETQTTMKTASLITFACACLFSACTTTSTENDRMVAQTRLNYLANLRHEYRATSFPKDLSREERVSQFLAGKGVKGDEAYFIQQSLVSLP